jgi:LmbE family N-acetylglucosaminyl deacetylase
VVITHDQTGGYFHPDHIFCWKITTSAFHAAGDPDQYPEIGPGPYQPQRLYYTVISRRWVACFVLLMRLRGQNPTKVGRDRNIDLTKMGVSPRKISTYIDYGEYWEVKQTAMAQHSSQGGAGGLRPMLPVWVEKKFLAKEAYVRAYPPAPEGLHEDDLFLNLA